MNSNDEMYQVYQCESGFEVIEVASSNVVASNLPNINEATEMANMFGTPGKAFEGWTPQFFTTPLPPCDEEWAAEGC